VRSGRKAGAYADELVAAAARLVGDWGISPAWVTAVPGRPEVEALAEALAGALDLPHHAAVLATGDKAPQDTRENSAQQVANVLDAFAVADGVPAGPVLLVDDTVSSRWTLTVVGTRLRAAGVEAVFPLVLAQR
jgi:ATP-dependent DNA helicase RecQ